MHIHISDFDSTFKYRHDDVRTVLAMDVEARAKDTNHAGPCVDDKCSIRVRNNIEQGLTLDEVHTPNTFVAMPLERGTGVQMNDAPVFQKNCLVLARGRGIGQRLGTIPAQQCEADRKKEQEGETGNQARSDSAPGDRLLPLAFVRRKRQMLDPIRRRDVVHAVPQMCDGGKFRCVSLVGLKP